MTLVFRLVLLILVELTLWLVPGQTTLVLLLASITRFILMLRFPRAIVINPEFLAGPLIQPDMRG